jgi:hypothetical protein
MGGWAEEADAAIVRGRRWSKKEKRRELLERKAKRTPTAHGDQRGFNFKFGIAAFRAAAPLSAAKRKLAIRPN